MIKKIIAIITATALLIIANGCYYIFFGQQKSAKKISTGKELNLYECCSIYSMHTAIWMFGWPLSPEAAEQALLMNFQTKPRYRKNDFFLKSKPVYTTKNQSKRKINYDPLDFTGPERRYALALDGGTFYNYNANHEFVVSAEYGSRTDTFKIGPVPISIHYSLLKYIQDKGWIHKFTMTYVDPYFDPI